MKRKKKIIVDTDPGHDDALAIMLVEKSKLLNPLAFTTVAGNSTIQNTTNNARYILDLLNSETPLFSGASEPLKKELVQANVHGESGLSGVNPSKKKSVSGNAPEKIIEIIENNPKETTILTLAPLTNLAKAIEKKRGIITQIKEVVIMGGAIDAPGNQNRVAEFNIFVDPEAADIVFSSGLSKTLIPLDVCNQVGLSLEDFNSLKDTPFYEKVKIMMNNYIEGIFEDEGVEEAIMYDPLAAYYLINPEAFTTKRMNLQIETEGDITRGMTVPDKKGGEDPNIKVATSVDKEAFVADFFDTLRS